jgi:hypothetical protein
LRFTLPTAIRAFFYPHPGYTAKRTATLLGVNRPFMLGRERC